ncbi:actin family [Flagelloscypha sp. PMI_526]|nr:actin family [Flagelloscypha sp. PMI_526]
MVTYGGDEVAALVLDIGTSSIRAGYAGDDSPRAVIPTSYGYIKANETDVTMGDPASTDTSQVQMFLGHSGPSLWRPNMEVQNPIQDGLIHDWNPIPQLLSHAIKDQMRCDPSEHPILVTEPAWNTPANRERMAEIMFEQFQVPAFYIANTGVLNAFAAGKGSALVVDVGEANATVTPVVDGFVLRKGMQHSLLPQFIRAGARHQLLSPNSFRPAIQLLPHQLVASKTPGEPNAQPLFALREDRFPLTTESWNAWAENREVDEWMQSVGAVAESGWNEQVLFQRPPKYYEFPNGFNGMFRLDRFLPGEQFFWMNQQIAAAQHVPKTLSQLMQEALRACDPEIRNNLCQHVVLTGGGSLLHGLSERLNFELTRSMQGTPVRLHAPGNPIERKYGAWLGGSILASLGTFHQLWISKAEWEEHGKPIVAQRCK